MRSALLSTSALAGFCYALRGNHSLCSEPRMWDTRNNKPCGTDAWHDDIFQFEFA
jgi:hypothetical protein